MDVALDVLDPLIFDKAYSWILPHLENAISFLVFGNSHLTVAAAPRSLWPRDNIYRQCISILLITQVGVTILYLAFSGLSYYFLFDRRLEYHPRFLKNQVRQEIKSSLIAIPFINVLTLPWFLGELRGYSLLYSDNRHGWVWLLLSFFLYMAFNDVAIYWIHRLEHHPCLYKHIHKPHHKWIIPTPWAALAFHPLDGYVQSLPYHAFVFICPTNKYLYMGLFVAVQFWTIFIHDGDMISGHWTGQFINNPAHHTLHHMHFKVNYGQYFTWCDIAFGSHRAPKSELDPIHDALKVMKAKGLIDEGETSTKTKYE